MNVWLPNVAFCLVFLVSRSECERKQDFNLNDSKERVIEAKSNEELMFNGERFVKKISQKASREDDNVHRSMHREILSEKQDDESEENKDSEENTERKYKGPKRIRRNSETKHDLAHTGDEEKQHDEAHEKSHSNHKKHHESHVHSWSYYGVYGPSNWSLVASACSSEQPRQTPIDIRTDLTKVDETMSDIELLVYDSKPDQKITITNNGHTVNLVFDNMMRVKGGKLGSVFRVAGVHFHWGEADFTGSEHTINGKRFPLEMHVVSYDEERHSGVASALEGKNSLAVLGVLFTISEKDNEALEPIISSLMSIQVPGHSTHLEYFDLRTLLPTKYRTNFYRYLGSLTTPPCSEVVVWTVFEHTIAISSSQLQYFRELYEGKNSDGEYKHLSHNWRPVQPLHGRTVVRSFLHHHSSAEATTPVLVQHQVLHPVEKAKHKEPATAASVANVHCDCSSYSSGRAIHEYKVYPSLKALIGSVALLFTLL